MQVLGFSEAVQSDAERGVPTVLCTVWINYKTPFVLIGYLSGE